MLPAGMVELWKDLVNRRKGTRGKKVDLILYPKTGLRKKDIQSDLPQHQTLQVRFGSIETMKCYVMSHWHPRPSRYGLFSNLI